MGRPQEEAVAGRAAEREPAAAPVEPAPEAPAGAPPEEVADAPATEEAAAPEAVPAAPTAEQQRDEYLAIAQRLQADFDNYRRRAARDVSAAGARARTGLLRELLPVVDNLERALASAGAADEGLVGGVGLVHADLLGLLRRSGVQAVEPQGERFDPNVHEAISTAPADGVGAGVVVEVVEKGYTLGDTVIRPARVVVSA